MNNNSINNLNNVNNLNNLNNLKEDSIETSALNNLEKYRSWIQVHNELNETSELLSNLKYMEKEIKELTDNGVIDEDSDEYHLLKGTCEQARSILQIPIRSADNIHLFYANFEQHITIKNALKNNNFNEGND